VSGWSADNADNAPPAAGVGGSGAPPNEPPAAWATPETNASAEPAWAMPEGGPGGGATIGAPDGATAGSATADPVDGWTSAPEPVAPPRLPVPLRAMTATDIIDGAWGIIKARPRTVFALTAIIILPAEVLAAFLAQGSVAILDLAASTFDSTPSSGRAALGGAGLIIAQLIQNLAPFFLGAAIARLVSSWYAGGDMTVRQALTAAFRKAPALIGAFAILVPIKLLGWATCGIALIFVLPLVMVTAPAIVIEDLGPVAGPKRAFDLARRRYWPCVGVWALALIVELVVNAALGLVPTILSAVVPGPVAPIVAGAGTVFAAFITKPFMVGVAVLLYLDLRVRTEGLDLELEAADAFARAA
jgi:hypothetical protein